MKKVVFCIIMAATIFATMEVALKIGGNGLDSFQLTAIRFLIGGLVLVPPAYFESKRSGYRLNAKDIAWMALLGIVGIAVSMVAFQIGVLKCNASTAAPLFCTNPLFAMVLAHLFTPEKMDKLKWCAFALGIAAAVFMIRPWDVQEGNSVSGMIIMIFAAVTFAAYSVMGKRSIARIGTYTQTSVSFIIGSFILLIITAVLGHPVISGIAENLAVVLYCGIIVTGIGYLFYFLAIRYSDASTGSITFFIKPAIAPVFAVLILHETVYWNTVAGIILLITASVLTILDAFRKEK
jgi:drug/metabolite transporter (DMT)-like permease